MLVWLVRLTVIFLVLTVIYVSLSVYHRWDRRRTLQADYDADPVPGQDRESFVAEGMVAYQHSLRRKLLWGVYFVPLGFLLLLILIANYT